MIPFNYESCHETDDDYHDDEEESWSSSPEREAREYSRFWKNITRGKRRIEERMQLIDEDTSGDYKDIPKWRATKPLRKKDKEELTPQGYNKLLKQDDFWGTWYPHPQNMVELISEDVEYFFG